MKLPLPILSKTILDQKSFNCPHCGAYSHMSWRQLATVEMTDNGQEYYLNTRLHQAICASCNRENVWYNHTEVSKVYPLPPGKFSNPQSNADLTRLYPYKGISNVDLPQCLEEMPEEIKILYKEATLIFELSPRSAAALIRLALEKLCEHLGVKKKNIKESIEELAKQQVIPLRVAQAADNIRLIGNANVHAGIICDEILEDINPAIFAYINLIVDYAIKKPKEIEEINLLFPEQKRASFEN